MSVASGKVRVDHETFKRLQSTDDHPVTTEVVVTNTCACRNAEEFQVRHVLPTLQEAGGAPPPPVVP